jgi:hypothetical protein
MSVPFLSDPDFVSPIPLTEGGTGSTTAAGARTAIGVSTVGNTGAYSDLTGIPSTFTPSAHSHVIADTTGLQTALDDKLASSAYTAADVLSKLVTVDGATSTLDADLLDGQEGTYYLAYTNFTGTPTLGSLAALSSVNNANWSGTALALANGGTGSTTAAGARSALGLLALATRDTINGSDWSGSPLSLFDGGTSSTTAAGARSNLGLGALATLGSVNNANWSGTALALGNGGTGATTASGARTALGLGSLAVANTVDNTVWSGFDLDIANGGTGASTASAARTNLGLGSLATASTINNSNWSGTVLAVANGGTGSSTGAGAVTAIGAMSDTRTRFVGERTTTQTISASTGAIVVCNGETFDDLSEHSTSTGRFTAANAGTYLVIGRVSSSSMPSGLFTLSIQVNGVDKFQKYFYNSTASVYNTIEVTGVVRLTAGQYIEMYCMNSTASSVSLLGAGTYTGLTVIRV